MTCLAFEIIKTQMERTVRSPNSRYRTDIMYQTECQKICDELDRLKKQKMENSEEPKDFEEISKFSLL